jgi:hypothetical protein
MAAGDADAGRRLRRLGKWLVAAMAGALVLTPAYGQVRDRNLPLTPEQLEDLQHKHPGQPGALDPENLAKPRAKAPFDLTGTWFVDLSAGFNKFMFGPPYPEFYEPGQQALKDGAAARARG